MNQPCQVCGKPATHHSEYHRFCGDCAPKIQATKMALEELLPQPVKLAEWRQEMEKRVARLEQIMEERTSD